MHHFFVEVYWCRRPAAIRTFSVELGWSASGVLAGMTGVVSAVIHSLPLSVCSVSGISLTTSLFL